ncbi:hypothetical protein EV1_037460 [Malus domestica]
MALISHPQCTIYCREMGGLTWNTEAIDRIFCVEEAALIKHIQLSPFQTNHILIWNAEANGKFSSQSAYHLAQMHGDVNGGQAGGSVLNGDVKFLWKAIWRAKVPEKVKICVWRCCLNAVPTPSNLKKKKVLMEISCIFCRGDEETIKHLLRDCPRSVAVIAEQKFWIGLPKLLGKAAHPWQLLCKAECWLREYQK